ncbi:MAG: hypothetical protein RLP14_04580 [Owenweeksia sp.]
MKQIIALLILFTLSSASCDKSIVDKTYSIKFYNNTQEDLRLIFGLPKYGQVYPDTVLSSNMPFLINARAGKRRFLDSDKKYEEVFRDDLPADTLSIYVFDIDTINQYPWDTIAKYNLVEERLDFSLSDLINRNYEIQYP